MSLKRNVTTQSFRTSDLKLIQESHDKKLHFNSL